MVLHPLNETGELRPEATVYWWRVQLREVWVFLFLIVPSMAISLFAIRRGHVGFVLAAWAVILRDLGLVLLVAYFLWRNGEGWGKLGWTLSHLWREIALGVVLFIPFFMGVVGTEWLLKQAGLKGPSAPLPSFATVHDAPQVVLALLMVAMAAVAEETIFRGYLLLRFGATMRNMTLAVICSSLVFALGHGYEGTVGLATVGLMGVALCLLYLWRGSLVAAITVHFLQDFVAIVLVGILKFW